jgi:hypothetical protein
MAQAPDWLDESVPAWLADFAAAIGVEPPTEAEIEQLLKLAGVAAHSSRRQAAPIATWLSARAGLTPAEALAKAAEVASRA